MGRRDPLFPNAAIVARREYRDRTHSRLFRLSTVILMALALGVAMAPITLRYLDRSSVDVIVVVAPEERLAAATVATANGIMNIPPVGTDAATWTPPYVIERGTDLAAATEALGAGRIDAILEVNRTADGALSVVYRTAGPANGVLSQLAGFTALSVGIVDWTRSLPPGSQLGAFRTPEFRTESSTSRSKAGRPWMPCRSPAAAS